MGASAISSSLRRLVDGGAFKVERIHVLGALRRLKVYQLTPKGEAIALQMRSSSGSKQAAESMWGGSLYSESSAVIPSPNSSACSDRPGGILVETG
jgi:DNA-binding PadR family transcriptional regulator